MPLINISQFIFSVLDGNFCVFQFRSVKNDFFMNSLYMCLVHTSVGYIFTYKIAGFRVYISSDFLSIARLFARVVIPIYTSTNSM